MFHPFVQLIQFCRDNKENRITRLQQFTGQEHRTLLEWNFNTLSGQLSRIRFIYLNVESYYTNEKL